MHRRCIDAYLNLAIGPAVRILKYSMYTAVLVHACIGEQGPAFVEHPNKGRNLERWSAPHARSHTAAMHRAANRVQPTTQQQPTPHHHDVFDAMIMKIILVSSLIVLTTTAVWAQDCLCPDGTVPDQTARPPCSGGPPTGTGCRQPPVGRGGATGRGGTAGGQPTTHGKYTIINCPQNTYIQCDNQWYIVTK
jgi:hypothetical protein